MYDTVQTAPDLVVKICMDFKLAALNPKRDLLFSGDIFSNVSAAMSFGALIKNNQHF